MLIKTYIILGHGKNETVFITFKNLKNFGFFQYSAYIFKIGSHFEFVALLIYAGLNQLVSIFKVVGFLKITQIFEKNSYFRSIIQSKVL